MKIIEFLTEIREQGIEIWVEGDRLRFSAPKGIVTPEVKEELAKRKSEIIKFLRESGAEKIEKSPLESISRAEALPLSFSQEALWFLHQTNPDSHAYNIYDAVRLKGQLRVEILERALQEIVRRHESIRTTFVAVEGQPFQHIAPPGTFSLSKVDLRGTPESVREEALHKLSFAEVQKPFDLTAGPLFRAFLYQLDDEQNLFLLTAHHSISDGGSIAIFRHELTTLYSAFCEGKCSPLADLSVQCADFAIWQRKWMESEDARNQISHWKHQLKGSPVSLELPTDYSRPPVQTFRGKTQHLKIPMLLGERLKEIGKAQNCSLFMVFLAAFKVLLFRYSNQEDIVVGIPLAGRNQPETKDLYGYFVNVLPLRSDLSGNPAFIELLDRIRETFLDAFSCQDVPFEKLVAELHPKRDQSRNPIFQVSFTYDILSQEFELPGLKASFYDIDRDASHFDFGFFLEESVNGIRGYVEYNTDLFDTATISRFIGHYLRLLEGIVENPGCSISKLPLLTPEDEGMVLVEWNRTEAEYPKELCLHELFERQADRTIDSIAVVSGEMSLSYGELNRRSNHLAIALRAAGVRPDSIVGLCVERSLDLVIGVLGILKAGGAYLPLDIAYPKDRLAFMLEDTRAPVLLTQRALASELPQHNAKLIYLDELTANGPVENTISGAKPNNLAYVIYTSGSTGKPKGVLLEHRNTVNLITSILRDPGFTAQDVMLSVTTLSFDIATAELFLPLCSGGKLVLANREVATDGEKLLALLNSCKATFLQPTPVTWQMLLDAGWPGSPKLKMISTGEPLPHELAARLLPKGAGLWNLYGPTETTIWSTGCQITSTDRPISIGKPVANTRAYILDAHQQPVPVGVPGELYLGGDGLARGYLNRPELTAEKFVPNPFAAMDGSARLYRTGDLARWRTDSSIECLGRIDHQIKLRGFRIELGEIEAVLDSHPSVNKSAVIASEDTRGEKRLVAYYVAEEGKETSINELRRYLKDSLPNYMVPSAFVILPEFPMTPNRKIDRKSLPEPDQDQPDTGDSYVAPRTDTEKELCRIWSELFKVKNIGIHDDFFDLGGHSLLLTRVRSQIMNAYGVQLKLEILFRDRTVAVLAERIETMLWSMKHNQDQATLETDQSKNKEIDELWTP